MSTFITKLPTTGTGVRLAVKDLIDVEGVPTTAGSKALADTAEPAASDAPCMAGARAAGARIVGKANLYELAYGTSGENPFFGTPVNPLDPGLVPGGSSSGSATAVAYDDADVAYGSDTGGSVRIPAACCGIAGLKTTHGRIQLAGVWPLAPSLDTVGPMAVDVAGLVLGMQLLEPGFQPTASPPRAVGRLRGPRVTALTVIDASIDDALAAAELDVSDIELPGWDGAASAVYDLLDFEAWQADRALYLRDPGALSQPVRERLEHGSQLAPDVAERARAVQRSWRDELDHALQRVDVLALPTMLQFPQPLGEYAHLGAATSVFNLGGHPALALPIPTGGRLPASLQLVAPRGGEEQLLALGAAVEAAVGAAAR